MKEKQPTTGIDFGVPKFSILYDKAINIIEQDYEIDKYRHQNKLEWLYNCYKESIYPECENAWQLSLYALLADADLDELLAAKVEHWYMGYAPPKGNENIWSPTLINIKTAINKPTDKTENLFSDLAIDELNHLKVMLENEMITEEEMPEIANRAAALYIDCNASLSVTLYDEIDNNFNDKICVLSGEKFFVKRAPATSYHKPISLNSDHLLTRLLNDDLVARDAKELEEILANSWANAQVIREYGYVIGCGSIQLADVVEMPNEAELSSICLPSSSEPSE